MGMVVGGVAAGPFVAGAVMASFMSKTSRTMSTPCIQSRDPENCRLLPRKHPVRALCKAAVPGKVYFCIYQ